MKIHLLAYRLKGWKGLTLIELLVAMAISAILIAAIYRTFIGQYKTYTVQEQVVDMQQNARVAINRMMREIRMAGFGSVSDVLALPDVGNGSGVNGFTQVITPGSNTLGPTITIVGGFKQIRRDNGDPISIASVSGNQITLNYATDEFDGNAHRFICIGGVESNMVQSRSETILTLHEPLHHAHLPGTPIYKIYAITYGRRNNDDGVPVLFRDLYSNTGISKRDPVAENIEDVRFEYLDADGKPTAIPANIRMVKVTIHARTSFPDLDFKADPEFKAGVGGFRRRTISSNIFVRNMGANP